MVTAGLLPHTGGVVPKACPAPILTQVLEVSIASRNLAPTRYQENTAITATIGVNVPPSNPWPTQPSRLLFCPPQLLAYMFQRDFCFVHCCIPGTWPQVRKRAGAQQTLVGWAMVKHHCPSEMAGCSTREKTGKGRCRASRGLNAHSSICSALAFLALCSPDQT